MKPKNNLTGIYNSFINPVDKYKDGFSQQLRMTFMGHQICIYMGWIQNHDDGKTWNKNVDQLTGLGIEQIFCSIFYVRPKNYLSRLEISFCVK